MKGQRTARGNQCQLAINTLSPYRDPFFLSTSSSSSDSTMNPQSHQNETSFSEREQENNFFLRAPLNSHRYPCIVLALAFMIQNKHKWLSLYRFINNAQMSEGCVLTSTDTDTLSRTSCFPGCHRRTSEDWCQGVIHLGTDVEVSVPSRYSMTEWKQMVSVEDRRQNINRSLRKRSVVDFIRYIWKEWGYVSKHVQDPDDEKYVSCLSVNQQNPIKLEPNQDLETYISHGKCES